MTTPRNEAYRVAGLGIAPDNTSNRALRERGEFIAEVILAPLRDLAAAREYAMSNPEMLPPVEHCDACGGSRSTVWLHGTRRCSNVAFHNGEVSA